MNPLRLRLMTRTDLPFADSLRALVGWNQTRNDWERFLSLEPQGCFVAEWNGELAGTATTVCYGRELAWIGMVIVHPDHRRHGLGSALLKRCLGHLRGRGVRCIKLDATPLGRPVYNQLGFKEEWTLTRYQREPSGDGRVDSGPRPKPGPSADPAAIDGLDTTAFGVSRRRLVQSLSQQAGAASVMAGGPGDATGYGLLRPGSQACYLGPLVAKSSQVAGSLVEAMLAGVRRERVFWDIPDQNIAAVALARQQGFTVQRALTRMFLGENAAPGVPQFQFGIGGPECG